MAMPAPSPSAIVSGPPPIPMAMPAPLPAPKPIKAAPRKPVEHPPELKQEAQAALGAYDELGPDYQDAVIESFLARMDQMNATRQRPPMMPLGQQPYPPLPVPAQMPMPPDKQKNTNSQVVMTIVCVALAIPLTAIAGGMFGLTGLLATWVGIIFVALVLGRTAGGGRRRRGFDS